MQMTSRAILTVGALLLCAAPLWAAPARHHIGEPWEATIDRGVVEQRAAVRRGTAPKQLVERALRAVAREDSVTKSYLLARAYGVQAQWHRARESQAKAPAVKQRHARDAQRAHGEALAAYRHVLGRAPRCYYAAHDMGVLTLQSDANATRAAFDHFSVAYRINDRFTPTLRQLIALYLAGKQVDIAVPLLEGLLALEPKDEEARARLVAVYTSLGKTEPAYAQLERLLAKRPSSIAFLALRADLDTRTARYDRAMNTYQRLARANPNVPTGFVGMISVIQKRAAKGEPRDVKNYLFALKGLYRLERDPKRREAILKDIRRAEHMLANPGRQTTKGPPSTPQLLHMLESPDEKVRVTAARYLLGREEPPTPDILRKLAPRLSPAVEPLAPMRLVVVSGLGRVSGSRLAPLLRTALADPSLPVRIATVDTLVSIARRDSRISGAVIAVLGLSVEARDVELAAASRTGILSLTDTFLSGVGDESDDAAWAAAFKAWWTGASGIDVQIRALNGFHEFKDHNPEQILLPYLTSPDFFVWRAAYRALERSAAAVRDPSRKRWLDARPLISAERLIRANWSALKTELAPWVAARPGR